MTDLILSLITLLVVITFLIFYIKYLLEILKNTYSSKWYRIIAYLLITFVPVIGLIVYKYWLKKILV